MLTVVFEDRQQDFLEWDIQDGLVVACRPRQADLWVGTRVHTPIAAIRPGVRLEITSRYQNHGRIVFPVKQVCSPKQPSTERTAPC